MGHGLEVAGDAAIGLGVFTGTEAAGDLLLDLAHAQVALGTVVGERHVGELGKEQDSILIVLESLPEVMGVGFRHPAAAALRARGKRRELLGALGEDSAVALAQALVLHLGQLLAFAFSHLGTRLLEQALEVVRPRVAVGLDDEGELAQQVGATQAMAAVGVGQVGGPAVVDEAAAIAGDDVDRRDGFQSALGVKEFQGDVPAGADIMGWSPLPEAASTCQGGDENVPPTRRGDRDEDYDDWDRSGKERDPGAWCR